MQATNMGDGGLLGVADILHECAGCADRQGEVVGSEALEVEGAKLVGQQARRAGQFEVPGGTGTEARAVGPPILISRIFRDEQLGWLEALQFSRERGTALRLEDGEAAGGEIQPGESESIAVA